MHPGGFGDILWIMDSSQRAVTLMSACSLSASRSDLRVGGNLEGYREMD